MSSDKYLTYLRSGSFPAKKTSNSFKNILTFLKHVGKKISYYCCNGMDNGFRAIKIPLEVKLGWSGRHLKIIRVAFLFGVQ